MTTKLIAKLSHLTEATNQLAHITDVTKEVNRITAEITSPLQGIGVDTLIGKEFNEVTGKLSSFLYYNIISKNYTNI